MSKQEELKVIATLKTWMMLLVVLYHSAALWSPAGWFNQKPQTPSLVLPVLTEYLNTIHIYVFAFASGYLFYFSNFIKKNEFDTKAVIRKRAAKLLVPYGIVTVFWLLPFELFFFHEGAQELISKFLLGTAPRQLWFLLMLWGVNVVFCFWIKWIRKSLSLIKGMLFLYGIYIMGAFFIRTNIPNYFQIFTVMRYLLFFFFGYAVCREGIQLIKNIHTVALTVGHVTLFVLVYYLNNYAQGLFRTASIFLTPIVSLTGIIVFYKLVDYMTKRKERKHQGNTGRIGILFRENEFAVYLFHQQWIWVVVYVMNNPHVPPILIVFTGFFVSVMISVLMAVGLKRIPKAAKLLSI